MQYHMLVQAFNQLSQIWTYVWFAEIVCKHNNTHEIKSNQLKGSVSTVWKFVYCMQNYDTFTVMPLIKTIIKICCLAHVQRNAQLLYNK